MKYYEINENAARTAHDMNSMSDYRAGQTTAAYRQYVDRATEIAEEQKERYPDEADRIDYLLDKYAKKLAEWYDKNSRVESMCPSILISGGGNFNVRKKQQQNARRDTLIEEWNYIQGILDKIQSTGKCGIRSNDERAVEKLQEKLDQLESKQTFMKAVNAWYRLKKTLDGCPMLNMEQIEKFKAAMARSWRTEPKPFESYELTNNNAEIHRVKDRIEKLIAAKEKGTTETEIAEIEGLKVVENSEAMRIQLIFDGKPDEETRTILKQHGFRWSPRFMAWQRELNANGRFAAKQVLEKIKALDA